MKIALLDGDTFVYQAAIGSEFTAQWDDSTWSVYADFDKAAKRLDDLTAQIREHTGATRLAVALSDYAHPNWRLGVMPTYKENRDGSRRPLVWQPLREYIEETYETYMRPTLEGDDVLGILATNPKLFPDDAQRIICSIDKDLLQIPGWHFPLKKMMDGKYAELDMFEVTTEQADRFHMEQALTGDMTDGFPGCPKVGKVTAARLLEAGQVLAPQERTVTRGPRKGQIITKWLPEKPGTDWEVVVSAYEAAGQGEEEALATARVARICRWTDYNYKAKEVKLWTPR